MFRKFLKQTPAEKTISELEKFQGRLHSSSLATLALMDLEVLPNDEMAKQKALLTHELSHAIKDILNGMTSSEAIAKITSDSKEEE